eukprot:12313609-Alexandrium_andersonii.AAC.1
MAPQVLRGRGHDALRGRRDRTAVLPRVRIGRRLGAVALECCTAVAVTIRWSLECCAVAAVCAFVAMAPKTPHAL